MIPAWLLNLCVLFFFLQLLAPDIRHERNVLLQCVRYIVRNNFFGLDRPQPNGELKSIEMHDKRQEQAFDSQEVRASPRPVSEDEGERNSEQMGSEVRDIESQGDLETNLAAGLADQDLLSTQRVTDTAGTNTTDITISAPHLYDDDIWETSDVVCKV